MLPHQSTEAQRVILSVSHSHLNNFCNKWGTDGICEALQLENWTTPHWYFLLVMVVHSVKCITQTRQEGLGLSFPCTILTTVFGHHSSLHLFFPNLSLALFFSSYSCRAARRRLLRMLSWAARSGTNAFSGAVSRPLFDVLSERTGLEAGG